MVSPIPNQSESGMSPNTLKRDKFSDIKNDTFYQDFKVAGGDQSNVRRSQDDEIIRNLFCDETMKSSPFTHMRKETLRLQKQ